MKPPKISPCPRCKKPTSEINGPGILESIPIGAGGRKSFRIGCGCGARGPSSLTVSRAIEVWNEMEKKEMP